MIALSGGPAAAILHAAADARSGGAPAAAARAPGAAMSRPPPVPQGRREGAWSPRPRPRLRPRSPSGPTRPRTRSTSHRPPRAAREQELLRDVQLTDGAAIEEVRAPSRRWPRRGTRPRARARALADLRAGVLALQHGPRDADGERSARYYETIHGGGGTPAAQKKVAQVLDTVQDVHRAEIAMKRRDLARGRAPPAARGEHQPGGHRRDAALAQCLLESDPSRNADGSSPRWRSSRDRQPERPRLPLPRPRGGRRRRATCAARTRPFNALELNANNLEASRELRIIEMRAAQKRDEGRREVDRRDLQQVSEALSATRPARGRGRRWSNTSVAASRPRAENGTARTRWTDTVPPPAAPRAPGQARRRAERAHVLRAAYSEPSPSKRTTTRSSPRALPSAPGRGPPQGSRGSRSRRAGRGGADAARPRGSRGPGR